MSRQQTVRHSPVMAKLIVWPSQPNQRGDYKLTSLLLSSHFMFICPSIHYRWDFDETWGNDASHHYVSIFSKFTISFTTISPRGLNNRSKQGNIIVFLTSREHHFQGTTFLPLYHLITDIPVPLLIIVQLYNSPICQQQEISSFMSEKNF